MRHLSLRAGALLCVAIAASSLVSATALAQDGPVVRQAPATATASSSGGNANSSAQLGEELMRLSDRIGALERLVSRLVAGQDEGQRSTDQLASEFARFKADAEARIEAIELEIASEAAHAMASTSIVPIAGPQSADAPAANVSDVAPALIDRFGQGMDFAGRQDWSQAELAFDTFIANNPEDERIPVARYQLGLAYLGLDQPAQAARIFLDLFETGAAAAFGADNLFALARALQALDAEDTEQLCTVYSEIETSYRDALTPDQREMLLDRRLADGCIG